MSTLRPIEILTFPINLDQFISVYFEKTPFLSSKNLTDFYQSFFSLRDISSYLERNDIRYPSLRLIKNGSEQPQSEYLKNIPFGNHVFDGVIDKDKIWSYYGSGSTIVFQALHRSINSLGQFCNAIEDVFGCNIQCNAYLTPPSSKGFLPHYDYHDVFILQIHGDKNWKVYDSPDELPLAPFDKNRWKKNAPSINTVLGPGDSLYIPRGFVHEAETTVSHSLHLTLGLLNNNWTDVLNRVIGHSANQLAFRKSFNINDLSNNEILENIKVLFESTLKSIDISRIRAEIEGKIIANSLTFEPRRLIDILNTNNLVHGTALAVRSECVFKLSIDDQQCRLEYNLKRLLFPLAAKSILEKIPSQGTFKIDDLEKDNLKNSITVCRKLIKEGLLEIVSL